MYNSRLNLFGLFARHIPVLLLLGLLIPGVLIGCGSTATKYYVLDTAAVKKITGITKLPTIAIRQLEIPPYLDRPHMVSRDRDSELHIAEYYQWGGRLRDNMARTLADDLGIQLGSPDISTAPQLGAMNAEVSLLVDIRQFERLPDGYLHLKVRWQLLWAGDVVQSHLNQLSSDTRINSDDYAAMAQGMGVLLGKLSEKMAVAIVRESSLRAK